MRRFDPGYGRRSAARVQVDPGPFRQYVGPVRDGLDDLSAKCGEFELAASPRSDQQRAAEVRLQALELLGLGEGRRVDAVYLSCFAEGGTSAVVTR